MAENENGQAPGLTGEQDKQTRLLEELVAEVRGLRAGVSLAMSEFAKYQPILDAYLRPTSPVGWAVKRAQAKKERQQHGPD